MGILDRLKRWWSAPDPGSYEPPPGIPAPDRERELVLYKFDTCPFCQRVLRVIHARDLDAIQMADTHQDPGAREQLLEETGRTTVPCLFVDGTPLFESADIKTWLQVYAARGFGHAT